ncbi:hypothetical protein C4K05_3284 [Pseudomonas chlororaphis subsp. aureofaciens]|uniref:Uncharacterized protein n=1 Tax=Pseudomonas chlororaphis subsp. aureofaciens TaxID=587851 RepID=A0AAD0ZEW2_9PSED|nr:hypothetical protein C4K10_3222 [Pseudomonas chlororaphis subsp. aureofaciens]AZE23721.1 hypothetical protein C4K08_3294 [Pseudomonas chlororaphis subsp. aureofaciens]AZE29977.1 hypothetical protein C4K07_3192 [Pseudomonas chlororaphis subsp. aureofaciens]AZE42624.1 hypothetical protein C4K05_3284 [Pseudomonas chlororaphis subsp. aureofaciens]
MCRLALFFSGKAAPGPCWESHGGGGAWAGFQVRVAQLTVEWCRPENAIPWASTWSGGRCWM